MNDLAKFAPLGLLPIQRPPLTKAEREGMILSLQQRHGSLKGIEEITDENLRALFGDKPKYG